jgi:parallel beta-helix repeat protein
MGSVELKGVARAGVVVAALTALFTPAASADTIDVHQAPNAIQHAINSASGGDTLRIHSGVYHEAVDVNKALTLVGVGDTRPVINGDCGSHFTVESSHNGVTLKHLKVTGADDSFESAEVDFSGRASGRAKDLVVRDHCDADYGINVFNGQQIKVLDSSGIGFDDSAIYIGGISSTGGGSLVVSGNNLSGNNRGIIIEDSVQSTDIRVTHNLSHDNDIPPGEGSPAGIFVHNSDGVLFRANTLNRNGDGSEGYGIHLDSNSDNNRLFDNIAHNNETDAYLDEGTGNCGGGNSFSVFVC